ncbi:ribbon-helix-helix protein, CopG family [Metallosphaera sedula]|uniref:ribbon-helix-helix protein, CopG family n=1 Tax=Metallosphaera sedula TaxID=43687 RepID=UPI0020BE1F25|nr:ribbon-helix-helix protein, CopG family [Metallosphaera sedula]BBL48371.1 hypothetical protein MJ1HA_2493 [Metallosphaera sedula]
MRVVTFKADEGLLQRLDLYATNNRQYRSEVIREAIEFYLLNYSKNRENYKSRTVTEEI